MTTEASSATVKRISVSGILVEVVRKDIKNLHLGVYPPLGRVRVKAAEEGSDEEDDKGDKDGEPEADADLAVGDKPSTLFDGPAAPEKVAGKSSLSDGPAVVETPAKRSALLDDGDGGKR